MWYPYMNVTQDMVNQFLAIMDNDKVKEALSERIRVEIDTQRTKYDGYRQSFNSLTSGSVNMQARMAASGYDVYGRVMLDSTRSADNNNAYKKMKNRLHYGRQNASNPIENRGSGKRL